MRLPDINLRVSSSFLTTSISIVFCEPWKAGGALENILVFVYKKMKGDLYCFLYHYNY